MRARFLSRSLAGRRGFAGVSPTVCANWLQIRCKCDCVFKVNVTLRLEADVDGLIHEFYRFQVITREAVLTPHRRLNLKYVVGCIYFAMEELDNMAEHEAARLLEAAAVSLVAKAQLAAKEDLRHGPRPERRSN
jgi:hypothetical protein